MSDCTSDNPVRPNAVILCANKPEKCRLQGGCTNARFDAAARFSRPTEQHFLGKCDASIELAMPDEMKADLAAVAAIQKTTSTELARRVLSDFLYGRLAQVQRTLSR